MKRTIYLLAATALMAGCTQSEVLVDTPNPVPEVPRSISFNTFVDKATRATGTNSTALNDFYPTFIVNGWKTVGGETTQVFDNVTVNYYDVEAEENAYTPGEEWGDATTGWYYDYVRYWDNMATAYQFSAYTPEYASNEVDCTPDGTISIGTEDSPITVDETNLMSTPATELAFTGFKYDYMMAQSTNNNLNEVSLNFKHLMAKLNVRIRLDKSITTAQDVTVQALTVFNLGDKGYYTNALDEKGKVAGVSGWTISATSAGYELQIPEAYSLNNANANYHNHYVLEQLIIPQTVLNCEEGEDIPSLNPYNEASVYVEYTIGSETFKSYTPLANIFSNAASYSFEGGKQYTINITVGPKPIVFTAEVTPWETEVEGNLDME